MSLAPAAAHDKTVAVVPFQGESQKTAASQNTARFLQNRKQIGDIDHRVGGEAWWPHQRSDRGRGLPKEPTYPLERPRAPNRQHWSRR
jgi:hypothetical protein